MTDRREKIRPLLDELDADAVLVVALRDPTESGFSQQSLVAVSREDSLSSRILGPLGQRVGGILMEAFESAGVTTDVVDRTETDG